MAEETNPPEQQSEQVEAAAEPKAQDAADTPKAKPPAKEKPPAAEKAKKPKAPAVEDKPFTEFMQQDFLPALQTAAAKEGAKDMNLKFVNEAVPIVGASATEACWQVRGSWGRDNYQFNIYFPDADIQGKKGFSFSTNGAKPSILESFMIDERKVSLDLMVLYAVQRLNAEKLLARN
ncbi:DUF2996 domain-containing protein [Oscillatoria sp. FACHB-1406]|uniref:DUF2996 domain-containing protein n=1 Tax=Oscillatoria sp. FACHB-1406 TaxID=2692846 RepID=UPI0016884989|nr:DUF2996 domain-containing protein [Oscillatoria sp. FACHB-1406]MBD2577833.1 DUF2996 domain-containing protein [Oscillatoria sp. FACHB-1406]